MLEQLPHHILVLLQGQSLTIDIVVGIRLIEGVAPLQPSVIAAVPVVETVEQAVPNCLYDVLFNKGGGSQSLS